MKFSRLLLVAIIFIFLTCVLPVYAVGPGTGGSKVRVNDEKIGPYILLVATSPLPVRVGQMSVWVRVTDAATGQLRRDAVVTVQMTPRGGGQTLTGQATHKNAGNDYDYVAHFDVAQAGQWDITVTVEDAPGTVETRFVETVSRGSNMTTLLALAVPFVVLIIVVGMYLWRKTN
ncbi:MAG: hypothetical protein D6784_09375 [Chloroflexi bacterium]|nr:MAG: hypothetical protein D6784_09375 [Chloroflexota bacterium]